MSTLALDQNYKMLPSNGADAEPKSSIHFRGLAMAPRFCTDCGNILDISSEETVRCDCCGTNNESLCKLPLCFPALLIGMATDKNRFETTTTTSNNFPSALREKLTSKTQQLTSKDFEDTQKISRECPKCGAKEMSWSAVQLRSADEGTTIFYRCACGYR